MAVCLGKSVNIEVGLFHLLVFVHQGILGATLHLEQRLNKRAIIHVTLKLIQSH